MNADSPALTRLARLLTPDGRLLRVRPLAGGISAQVTALDVLDRRGTVQRFVVRQHGEDDRARNPNIAADEFTLLTLLAAQRIPAPAPVLADVAGEILSTPCIVLQYVEGSTSLFPADFAEQLAGVLARVHRIDRLNSALAFLSPLPEEMRPPPPANPTVLLHGDFWPGNVLWNDNCIASVIDWEDAALGDPLADVANMRLELLWAHGEAAMDAFTEAYRAHMPDLRHDALPAWDLWAARKLSHFPSWAGSEDNERRMRAAYDAFIARAAAAK